MSHELVGIVGFSFGLSKYEPNISNTWLALAVARAYHFAHENHYEPIVVVQWEINLALQRDHPDVVVDYVVYPEADGEYLDSAGVWLEAREFIREVAAHHGRGLPPERKRKALEWIPEELHITYKTFVIAQPFLHLPKVKSMIRNDGFAIMKLDVGEIPFDNSNANTQWWTKTRSSLMLYSIMSLIPGVKPGHNGRQTATY